MKVGLLAFHQAINFGATLQLLSTYRYLQKMTLTPIVINYVPCDLEDYYCRTAPVEQRALHEQLRQALWQETRLCRNARDVADVITEEHIEAVIIGSDAVCQCHTLRERLTFPCRTVIGVRGATTVETFPNAFWAEWNDDLPEPIPVAVISASSQDSKYSYFSRQLCRAMANRVLQYAYLSVRDMWTQKMMEHITRRLLHPAVTPDPVFAFAQNAADIIPSREDILRRYNLPERYLLLSFISHRMASQIWIDRLSAHTMTTDGTECVILPFAHKPSFGHTNTTIPLPLSPLDWYALIRYSNGYIGNNMHPIIVCLQCGVPFFSFDNYGLRRLNGLSTTDKSSKIRHILARAGLSKQRVSCIQKFFSPPTPEAVYRQLRAINHAQQLSFAQQMTDEYNTMMTHAINAIMQ